MFTGALSRFGLRLGAPGGVGFEGASFLTIGGDPDYVRATGAERLAKFRSSVPVGS